MIFDIILLVLWVILGVLTLCSPRPVSKTSYFCTWIVVVSYYVSRIMA